MAERRVRALVCKLGLDPHWRGSMVVSRMFRSAGMEVIYIGNSSPQEIVDAAVDEDVDIVGLSSLGGAHLTLGKEVIDLAKRNGVYGSRIFLMGGIIPPDDEKKLLRLGFHAVFGPGATEKQIIGKVSELLASVRKPSTL